MKILIVGAGIAGLTLAALLKQRGVIPHLIEKAETLNHTGYMIGLYPLGSDVLYGLNSHEQFVRETILLNDYIAFDDHSKLLNAMKMDLLTQSCGPYQMTTRGDLVELLFSKCHDIPIEFSTSIEKLIQSEQSVEVHFTHGKINHYDLVVGADGIHSKVRECILTPDEIEKFETGWGGWVWWSEESKLEMNVEEYWGRGSFFGIYPIPKGVGCIACLPFRSAQDAIGSGSRKARLLEKFALQNETYPQIFSDFPDDHEPCYYWPFYDIRCTRWTKGRVLLLGDAATAFLPTAGIGASMAMESAAVLNDILSRTDTTYLTRALPHFTKRRKERVEKAQNNSRKLAKYMFVKSFFQTKLRNLIIRRMSAQTMLKDIFNLFDKPI